VAEEGCVESRLVDAPRTYTYTYGGDGIGDLAEVDWALGGTRPLLAVPVPELPPTAWSLTYVAETTTRPSPGAESRALLFLTSRDVAWLTTETVSLAEFLAAGGVGAFAQQQEDLPTDLPLRPFGQLQALAVLLDRGAMPSSGHW
jgi:hypothetical protein